MIAPEQRCSPYSSGDYSYPQSVEQEGRTSGSIAKLSENRSGRVTWYFTDHVGIGWFTRYSRATVELPSAGNGTLEIKPGGLHTAGGLRLRF